MRKYLVLYRYSILVWLFRVLFLDFIVIDGITILVNKVLMYFGGYLTVLVTKKVTTLRLI